MHERDRFKYIALGLGVGVCLALLFLVWAVPEFRDPRTTYEYYQNWEAASQSHDNNQDKDAHYWVREARGWVFAEDSLAQWLMSALGFAATAFTIIAVGWARKAVITNQAQVRAYFRVGDFKWEWETVPFSQGLRATAVWENGGNSPARDCLFMKDFVVVDIDHDAPIESFDTWDRDGAIRVTVPVGQHRNSDIFQISGDDMKPIIDGSRKIVFYLAVEYTDVFGHTFVEGVCQSAHFLDGYGERVRVYGYPHHNHYDQIS